MSAGRRLQASGGAGAIRRRPATAPAAAPSPVVGGRDGVWRTARRVPYSRSPQGGLPPLDTCVAMACSNMTHRRCVQVASGAVAAAWQAIPPRCLADDRPPRFRFAQINDTHVQAPLGRQDALRIRTYPRANDKLRHCVETLNDRIRPDFVLAIGDLIHGDTLARLRPDLETFRELTGSLAAPLYPTMGNHEVVQREGDPDGRCCAVRRARRPDRDDRAPPARRSRVIRPEHPWPAASRLRSDRCRSRHPRVVHDRACRRTPPHDPDPGLTVDAGFTETASAVWGKRPGGCRTAAT